ncbi:MAG TPA: PTS sugar transporter subunit IIA [Thermoanaerobaculia bacterium]|nr:PTS sugar transporter subunit IIA [Thermoanaerobaculia bacterium]
MAPITDIAELLRADDIHLNFQAASVVDAIPLLLRPALTRRVKDSATVERAIDAAIAREHDTPTRCGPLGLPHARSSGVGEFIVALGANPAGVIAGQPQPRLIFAFVSPEELREQHLQLLAALARLSQNEWIVEKIAAASTPGQVFEALRASAPA